MDQFQQHTPGFVVGGRYKLDEPLGSGGMAEVWKAADTRMGTRVAIKFMHFKFIRNSLGVPISESSPPMAQELARQFPERFLREVKVAGKLIENYNYDYLVGIHDTGMDDYGNLYYVMDYVHGELLSYDISRYAHRMGLPAPGEPVRGTNEIPRHRVSRPVYQILDLYRIIDQLLDVVGYLHANGVIHRDIKPDNIMLVRDPDGRPSIRLLDLGIAKIAKEMQLALDGSLHERQLTVDDQRMGTPDYMPDESFYGRSKNDETGKKWETGPYTDLYALAMIMFEAVTGRMPYSELNPQERAAILREYDIPVPDPGLLVEDLTPRLRDVILKGLAKPPWMRYQNAAEMRNDLRLAEKIDKERIHAVSEHTTLDGSVALSFQPTIAYESLYPPPAEKVRTTLRSTADESETGLGAARVTRPVALALAALSVVGLFLFWFRPWASKADGSHLPSATAAVSASVRGAVGPVAHQSAGPTPLASGGVPSVNPSALPAKQKRVPESPGPAAKQSFDTAHMIATGPVKDCKGALTFYEDARRLAPNWPKAYLELGECQRKLGRLDQARESFRAYASFEGVPPLPPAARALVK